MKQSGFSLVEVMVSMFIVSIGVLCAAVMQLTALHTAQSAGYKTTALQLSSEMANQLRAYAAQGKIDAIQNVYARLNYTVEETPEEPVVMCYSRASSCNSTELAMFNVYEWKKRIKETLPKGRIVICNDVEPWDSAAGRYKWECSGTGRSEQLVIKIGWIEKKSNHDESTEPSDVAPPNMALIVGI